MKPHATRPLLALAAAVALAGCKDRAAATEGNFAPAITGYLAARGSLCLGKSAWPIEVTEGEAATASRNALQMPVLERLGLVEGEDAVLEVKDGDDLQHRRGRRYQLTAEGRKDYRARGGVHDLCVATLSLDRVTRWEMKDASPSMDPAGHAHAVVHYTYEVSAVPWIREPLAARVFPAVARVLEGAHGAELTEEVTLTGTGWVASDLLPSAPEGGSPGARADNRP